MFLYSDLEQEIVNKLNAYYTLNCKDEQNNVLFEARTFPETDEEMKALVEDAYRRAITVICYNESVFNEPSININQVIQEETVSLYVVFFNTGFREADGLARQLAFTQKCLLGFTPQHCSDRIVLKTCKKTDWGNLEIRDTLTITTKKRIAQSENFDADDLGVLENDLDGLGAFKKQNVLQL